jgi:hypothetical protein
MPDLAAIKDTLAKIRREWDKAEHAIKIAEQISGQVVFPAIKELRYAGRRVIDALAVIANEGSEAEFRALIDDALFCCYRGRHDAVDAAISTMVAEVKVALKKLGARAVIDAYPNTSNFLLGIKTAQEKVASSRGIRHDRDKLYTEIEQVDLVPLVDQFRQFQASDELMRALAKSDRFWPALGFWATIGSIIVALSAIGAAFYIG